MRAPGDLIAVGDAGEDADLVLMLIWSGRTWSLVGRGVHVDFSDVTHVRDIGTVDHHGAGVPGLHVIPAGARGGVEIVSGGGPGWGLASLIWLPHPAGHGCPG